jgi:hypothetical protein
VQVATVATVIANGSELVLLLSITCFVAASLAPKHLQRWHVFPNSKQKQVLNLFVGPGIVNHPNISSSPLAVRAVL